MSAKTEHAPGYLSGGFDDRIGRLRALEASDKRESLRAELKAALDQFPESPDIALIAFRVAVEDDELDVAADLLCDVLWPSLPDASIRRRCLDELLASSVDDEFSQQTLLRLLKVEPGSAEILIYLAAFAVERENYAGALEWLEQAEALASLPSAANALRIKALLNAVEWDDVFGRALERALSAAPEVRRLYALKHDFHEKRGERELARAILDLARDQFPDDPWFALRAFRFRLSDRDIQGAALLFREQIWHSSLPEATRRGALATMVREWKDPEELKPFLLGLLQDKPDDRFVLVKLATLVTRQRQHVEAARYLEKALEHGSLPPEAESMQVNMLILGGDAKGSLALAKRQLAANPDRKDLVRRANIVASICGNQDDVTETMRQAILQWPTDATIVQRYNRAVIPEAEDQSLFDHLTGFTRANSVDGRWHYQFALACLRRNDTPRARATLRNLHDDPLVGFEAQRLLGVLEAMPAEEWDARARFSNDPTRDVHVIETPSAKATVVVMAGLHGGLGNIPLTHLDVLLQEHPINVVYLRDNRWSAFTAGVPSLGPDEASTISALTALCSGLGPMPMITFGGSLGGWSAMRYGALAGARMAVSLSGPTRLAVQGDQAKRFTQYYLSRMLPEETSDLLDLLSRSASLRIMHVYGAENAKDRANAARLRQFASVTLVPVDGCEDHFVAAHLVARGAFHPLIEQAIAAAQTAATS
ncbi:tetratricopeptide repeat protein [Oryzicola mucosus]|uniref:Tetratricopeptide repeat protein n=1 Tax=Oryzicola mucosus TaxID=2767425 RepID=A0A8J6PKG7_9HYPH|nr:hypothetical protein [Oryzicola mucosus]MBD0415206.1 hypothetical protein [Oryzicola mucosus]